MITAKVYLWIGIVAFAILLGVGVWDWDRERLQAQFDAGVAKAQKECEESKAEAEDQVAEDVAQKEAAAEAAAVEREKKLDEALEKITQASSTAITLYRKSVNELSTLANGCRVPAGRMRAINEALGHAAAATETDVREVRGQ